MTDPVYLVSDNSRTLKRYKIDHKVPVCWSETNKGGCNSLSGGLKTVEKHFMGILLKKLVQIGYNDIVHLYSLNNAQMDYILSDLEVLSAEYIRLLNEKQVLLDWGKPQLEALYLLRVGQLQIKRLNTQLQIMALKRKVEMVTAAVNTGEVPDMVAIELEVASELAEAEQEILAASNEYANALFYFKHLDTPERASELRKVYCRLAKKLHPDVNPGLTEWHAQLWLKVTESYNAGDLDQLLALELVYQDELGTQTVFDEAAAASQSRKLKEFIVRLEDEIMMMRSQFPFTHEALLYDEDWIKSQQGILEAEIGQLMAYEVQLRSELVILLS